MDREISILGRYPAGTYPTEEHMGFPIKVSQKNIFLNFKVRDMVREYTVGEKYSPHKTCIAYKSIPPPW